MMKEVIDEEDVRSVLDFNICQILNKLMGPDCVYSRKSTDTPGIPDFKAGLLWILQRRYEFRYRHDHCRHFVEQAKNKETAKDKDY